MSDPPKTAGKVQEVAEQAGWSVKSLKTGPLFTLKMHRDETDVAAFWNNGRFSAGIVRHPPMKLNQRDLKDLLSTPVEEFGFDEWPPDLPDDERQNLKWEHEMCGFFISGHPLDYVNVRAYPDVVDVALAKDQDVFHDGDRVQVLGIVEEPQVKKSRRGFWIAFWGLSDQTGGLVRCFGFGREYEEMHAGMLVHVKGVIEERDGENQVKARVVEEVQW